MNNLWEGIIAAPLKGRIIKPRILGITMLIDKGLSLEETRELLKMTAPYIDFIKLSFGTTALYPSDLLKQKIKLTQAYGVEIYPGGTFFEIALWQKKAPEYFIKLTDFGFRWVEISDGSLTISDSERIDAINDAQSTGLKVITEVGKKDSLTQLSEVELIGTVVSDLEAGAQWVIIEARESGQGIGIYDDKGVVINEKLEKLKQNLPVEKIIWEAPLKSQQAKLINDFGPNVNLGNIPPSEAMALEALRLGFRSDTWFNLRY